VIQFYTTPCGEATWAKGEQLMGANFKEFAHFWKVSADEIVIAMDAVTGKTRWKQVFNDKGINICPGKRGGFAVTPCAADGKVFAMGTMGRLYCLDLATGKPVWESAVDSILRAVEEYKAQGIKDRKADRERPHRPYGFLLVVDGILLVHNWSGGLIGIDAATGKQLWQAPGCLSGFNCPAPVKVNGKQYIACVNGSGEIRMLDHKTGKVFWTHALKSQHLTQPVFGDECLMVFEPHPDGARIGNTLNKVANSTGVLAGYRLTEEGAARAWVLPSRYMLYLGLDSGPRRKIVVRNGLVYHVCDLARSANGTTSSQEKHLVIVREKDGQIVKEADVNGWNPYLWGDRLITVTDIQHRPRAANAEVWQMYNADPADFKPLGAGWHVNGNPPVHLATGGYEVPVLEPFADGLFFCRVWGGIRCYDLRH
jgi:outer membrane protein assembly factor BamB